MLYVLLCRLIQLSDFEKAEKDCSAALKINPSNMKALVRRCNARLERKDIRGAEQDVRSALKIEENDKELSKLLLRVWLSTILLLVSLKIRMWR